MKERIYWYLIVGLVTAGMIQWLGLAVPLFIPDKVDQKYFVKKDIMATMINHEFPYIERDKLGHTLLVYPKNYDYMQIVDKNGRVATVKLERKYIWRQEIK